MLSTANSGGVVYWTGAGRMARWLLISCSMAVFAMGLGACSSSGDGMTTRAELAANNDDNCQVGSGPLSGLAALSGPQAAYRQCLQERYSAGSAGFRPEDSFAAGHPSSLAAVGQ